MSPLSSSHYKHSFYIGDTHMPAADWFAIEFHRFLSPPKFTPSSVRFFPPPPLSQPEFTSHAQYNIHTRTHSPTNGRYLYSVPRIGRPLGPGISSNLLGTLDLSSPLDDLTHSLVVEHFFNLSRIPRCPKDIVYTVREAALARATCFRSDRRETVYMYI